MPDIKIFNPVELSKPRSPYKTSWAISNNGMMISRTGGTTTIRAAAITPITTTSANPATVSYAALRVLLAERRLMEA